MCKDTMKRLKWVSFLFFLNHELYEASYKSLYEASTHSKTESSNPGVLKVHIQKSKPEFLSVSKVRNGTIACF